MTDISSIQGSGLSSSAKAGGARAGSPVEDTPASRGRFARGEDTVSLTAAPERRARVASDPVRLDLVTKARDEIKAGKYETEERINGAVDALLRALGG